MKRIVFTKVNTAELLDFDIADPQEKEVQVALVMSSISSGTERAGITGSKTVSWNRPEATEAKFPRYHGYSSAGVITKTGPGVEGLSVGDRVALSWSTHSQLQNIKARLVHKLDDRISFSDGALTHIATFPLAAIRKCRLEMGESALVMGLGILGLLSVQLLRAAGAVPVIAADPIPSRREKALQLGADHALDPFDAGFADTVRKLTCGGAKAAIEVTGSGQALNQALDCMAKHGRVALLGCTRHSDFTVDYYHKVHGPGITLVGAHTSARPKTESAAAYWTDHDDVMAVLRLCAAGRIDLDAMIEETHAPEEAPAVYQRLIEEKCFPVVQFDWTQLK